MAMLNGDVARVEMRMTPGTSDIINTYHLQLASGGGQEEADLLDDLLAVFEALVLLMKTAIATSVAFDRIRAINETQGIDIGYADFVTTTTGALSGNAVALTNAAGITLYTPRLSAVGRKFLGGYGQSAVNPYGILAGVGVSMPANVIDFLTTQQSGGGSTWDFGIVSTTDGAFLPFVAGAISPSFVTQRRRRPGVGS